MPRQDRVPPVVAVRERQDQAPPPWRAVVTTVGCRAFTPVLRSIIWPRNSSLTYLHATTTPPTLLSSCILYELSIEADSSDEKVMANWFTMALKDGARS